MKQLTKTVGLRTHANDTMRACPFVISRSVYDFFAILTKLTKGTVIWKDNHLIIPEIRFKGFSFRFNILTETFYVPNVAF